MKLLVWKSKYGDVLVCARDPEEEKRAWLYLFKCMDEMEYYQELDEDEATAYRAAKRGNPMGAKWLLDIRGDYEYERITVETAVEP